MRKVCISWDISINVAIFSKEKEKKNI